MVPDRFGSRDGLGHPCLRQFEEVGLDDDHDPG